MYNDLSQAADESVLAAPRLEPPALHPFAERPAVDTDRRGGNLRARAGAHQGHDAALERLAGRARTLSGEPVGYPSLRCAHHGGGIRVISVCCA